MGESREQVPALARSAGLARPVALASERVVPVLDTLRPLLPDGGLRRGSVVAVEGSTSLALALLAGASAGGSWCAAVGFPSLGLLAAAELGVVLERFPQVLLPATAGAAGWAWAVAALADAVDVVLARPPAHLAGSHTRRLAARVRERSSVLVTSGGSWPGADVRLSVVGGCWEGVGEGHGRLRTRRVEVVAGGRGAAARGGRVALWLPAPGGGVAPADVVAAPVVAAAR